MSDGTNTALMERPETTKVAARRPPQVEDDGPLAFMMDSARFEHMQRISSSMAASVFLPEHLRGRKNNGQFEPYPPMTVAANCFRVLNQAMRWGVDPFAVADETFVTGGKLGYQGKLITAIVNSRAGLQGRLRYEFSGEGPARKVKILGHFKGMPAPVDVELTVKEGIAASDKGKGPNPMWLRDPDQKLVYSGVVKWARRHCPEVIMGVLTEEDIDAIEASRAKAELPTATNDLNERLRAGFTKPVATIAAPVEQVIDVQPGEIPNEDHEQAPPGDEQSNDAPAEAEMKSTPINPAAKTWQSFCDAVNAIAKERGLTPEFVDGALGKLKTSNNLCASARMAGHEYRSDWLGKFAGGAKLGTDGTLA